MDLIEKVKKLAEHKCISPRDGFVLGIDYYIEKHQFDELLQIISSDRASEVGVQPEVKQLLAEIIEHRNKLPKSWNDEAVKLTMCGLTRCGRKHRNKFEVKMKVTARQTEKVLLKDLWMLDLKNTEILKITKEYALVSNRVQPEVKPANGGLPLCPICKEKAWKQPNGLVTHLVTSTWCPLSILTFEEKHWMKIR